MRTFYILLNTWPKIVGKFCPFNYDVYFWVKAAHSISGSDDVVFSNWCVKDTFFTEFLLQTLRDIENTPFFFVCNILSPKKSVWIITKLSLQRFIERSNQIFLFTFLLMCTINI